MSFVMLMTLVVALTFAIAVSMMLHSRALSYPSTSASNALLWMAAVASGLMTLMSLAGAAWGMDTRLPWGIGIYMYLVPALSLPAFLTLTFSIRILSRVLWLLTILNVPAWFFGDRADRVASGLKPLSGLPEIASFLNVFTLLYIAISVLVQMAELRERGGSTVE